MGSSRKDIMPEDHMDLQEFDISPTLGFLSSSPPITRLPEEYDSWEHILSDLPRLIAQGQLEKTIKSLRSLETTYLTSELQWKRAYVLLAFIIHAYIWGQRKVIDTVPTELAEPFLQICAHFRMQPVLSYAGLCLWKWGTKLEGSYDLGNLRTSASFTGTADEAAFYLIPVMIESKGGHLVERLLNVIEAASREEWDVVSTGLKHCEATLRRMIDVLALMNAHCDPMVFFSQIRPFLAGPNVKFARANGEELHVTCVGGSGAQSTLFMSIDRLLGVTHDSTLFREMRAYMPGNHRDFLDILDRRKSLSDVLEVDNVPIEVGMSFAACLKALQDWRGKHIGIVTRYIVLPAARARAMVDEDSAPLIGTGGSPVVEFLKQSRDETVAAP